MGLLRRILPFVVAVCVASLSGCAHYRLGQDGEPGFSTLYIEPVENHAAIPQATALYSGALREAFLRDGRIRIVNTEGEADAVLRVDLQRFGRVATSARQEDTRLARKFDLELRAVCTLHDQRSNQDLFTEKEIEARRQIFTTGAPMGELSAQQQAEYNTHPLLANELARAVLRATLDTW